MMNTQTTTRDVIAHAFNEGSLAALHVDFQVAYTKGRALQERAAKNCATSSEDLRRIRITNYWVIYPFNNVPDFYPNILSLKDMPLLNREDRLHIVQPTSEEKILLKLSPDSFAQEKILETIQLDQKKVFVIDGVTADCCLPETLLGGAKAGFDMVVALDGVDTNLNAAQYLDYLSRYKKGMFLSLNPASYELAEVVISPEAKSRIHVVQNIQEILDYLPN